jgi:uncharacterized protein YggE
MKSIPTVLVGWLLLVGAHVLAAEERKTVQIYGEGQVEVNPDIAYIQLGVTTLNEQVERAASTNSKTVKRVLAAVSSAGLAERDMSTSNYSVSAERPYGSEDREPAYRVQNMVELTVRDLANVGSVLGAAMAAGANEVRSVRMELENARPALVEARRLAAQDAREKAQQLAELHGVELGPVLEISEEGGGAPLLKAMAMDAVPIRAGSQRLSVRLRVVYALR